MSRQVLLMGGGLESSLLYCLLVDKGEKFVPLWVDYGQRSASEEHKAVLDLMAVKPCGADLKIIRADYMSEATGPSLLFGTSDHPEAKGRALYLIVEAIKGFDTIYLGSWKKDDWLPDTTEAFVIKVNELLEFCFGDQKRVLAPLFEESIPALVDRYRAEIPSFLELIFSCWAPVNGQPCGHCKHCEKIRFYT